MKKYLFLILCVGFLCGCQGKTPGYGNDAYVTPAGYYGDNAYWTNNYRLNTSNYFGNQNFNNPGVYYQ